MRTPFWLVAVPLLASLGCAASSKTTASSTKQSSETLHAAPKPAAPSGVHTLSSGLEYEDLKVGDGPVAERGMTVTVHYTGWLRDKTKFDSSLDSGHPLSFVMGSGQVIPGWEEGIAGMRVGGRRRLTVPPEMGYGSQGAAPLIPPDATLLFEIELLHVQ
jgi:FKBP-type peptidyl-prolyl cis-trans isomerase